MRKSICTVMAVCLAAGSIGLGAAGSGAATEADPDRATYVQELEAICAPGAKATERAVKGVRENISRNRLGVAAGQFAAASRIFSRTVRRIAAVPQPSADAAALREWLRYLDQQETYLGKISGALRAGQKVRAQGYLARFVHSGNLANNVVLGFGFHYCRFNPTRFG